MATITRKSLSAVAVASLLAAGTFFGAGAVNGGCSYIVCQPCGCGLKG